MSPGERANDYGDCIQIQLTTCFICVRNLNGIYQYTSTIRMHTVEKYLL